jgi:dTDP-4-amino-4,6-dideoxygalactose transaminase
VALVGLTAIIAIATLQRSTSARAKANFKTRVDEMTADVRIPGENLTRQYQRIKDEVEPAILAVLPTGRYTLGPNVREFEAEFAAYCGTQHCAGISSGTEALHLALLACDVGPGDEVITVPNTYAATVFAISYVGARPVFVDVDPATFNLDPGQVEAKITSRTRAILPVHMYGQPVAMDDLLEVARRHGLRVIEDAAHAHGAEYRGRRAGSLGDIGCFSFYPGKVLGAYGDGGAVTTSDAELYDRVKVLRYMGQHTKYLHEIVGYQQRLDEIQAAVLRVKLRHLEQWIAERRRWAALYDELLAGLPIAPPATAPDVRHVYYAYTVRTPRREALIAYLAERGIGCFVMYPLEVPFQPAYHYLGHQAGDFAVADRQVSEILCLPMFAELTEAEVREVAGAIRAFFVERS